MARKKPPHEQNPADPKNWKHVTIKAGDVRVRPPLDWGDVDTLRVRLRREIHETPGRDLKLQLLDEWRMGLERRTRDTGRPDELQALWDDWTRIRGMVLGPEYRVSTAISPKPTKDINAPPSEDERQEPKCDLVPWPREDKTVGFAKLAEHVGKSERTIGRWRDAPKVRKMYPELGAKLPPQQRPQAKGVSLHRALLALQEAGFIRLNTLNT